MSEDRISTSLSTSRSTLRGASSPSAEDPTWLKRIVAEEKPVEVRN